MKRLLIVLIRGYQLFISPITANHCRYYPTCSHYAIEAVAKHGAVRGSYLTVRRLLRCHPYHAGGYDPVPPCHCHHTKNTQLSGPATND